MSDVCPVPIEVEFSGGEKFMLHTLVDRDFEEMDSWVRSSFITIARNSLGNDATVAEREETLSIAMKEAMSLSWAYGPGSSLIRTVEGTVRLFWQSLGVDDKKSGAAKHRSMMLDEGNVQEFWMVFSRLNDSGDDDDESDKELIKNP